MHKKIFFKSCLFFVLKVKLKYKLSSHNNYNKIKIMTIDTIKDVLGRILVINKNLNEVSLKTLLDASGWDADDIQEGMRIFRDYVANGNDMSKVSANIAATQLAAGIASRKAENAIENNSLNQIKQEIKEDIKSEVSQDFSKDIKKEIVQNITIENAPSIMDLTKKDDPQIIIQKVEEIKNEIPTIEVKKDILSVPPIASPNSISLPKVYNMQEDIHNIEEYVVNDRPWFLIGVNVVLFIITLSLLVYILMH